MIARLLATWDQSWLGSLLLWFQILFFTFGACFLLARWLLAPLWPAAKLTRQAVEFTNSGQYPQALQAAQEVLTLWNRHVGSDHPMLGRFLNNLAAIHREMGNHAEAERVHWRGLEIRCASLGDRHVDVANSLNNLAIFYSQTGNYVIAEPMFRRALALWKVPIQACDDALLISLPSHIAERVLPAHSVVSQRWRAFLTYYLCWLIHYWSVILLWPRYRQRRALEVSNCLNNLAIVYSRLGDNHLAQTLMERSLQIAVKRIGKRHATLATRYSNLGDQARKCQRYEEASSHYAEAMRLWDRLPQQAHPDKGRTLVGFGMLRYEQGNSAAAESLLSKALSILTSTLGAQHTDVGGTLYCCAVLQRYAGLFLQAEPLLRQAKPILERAFGEEHPDHCAIIVELARVLAATGRSTEAFTLRGQAMELEDRLIGQVFALGSESRRQAFLEAVQENLAEFLSLFVHNHANHPAAIKAALDFVLRRKALGAEALAIQRDAVLNGRYPHLREQLARLNQLRQQIVEKTLAGPQQNESYVIHRRYLDELDAEREILERDLARQIPEIRLEATIKKADRHAVAQHLPTGSVLIEFVRCPVFDFRAIVARGQPQWLPSRYFAFILYSGRSDQVRFIDLGYAEAIDNLVGDFRRRITGHDDDRGMHVIDDDIQSDQDECDGTAIRRAVFDPLVVALGKATRLFVVPDGELTRLPLEVLPVDATRCLIDKYTISYLTSGRDLLRFGPVSRHQPPVVVADPDFNLEGSRTVLSSGRHSRDLDKSHPLPRLTASRVEGAGVAALLGVRAWLGAEALDSKVRKVCSPHVLHLATHGCFLPDQQLRQRVAAKALDAERTKGLWLRDLENPLLRSWLLLAGFNVRLRGGTLPAEAGDGMLTAEDVSCMDLRNTALVVLSACDTGLGATRLCEGVFGMRRAFVLAGARTLVMSLWKVSDQRTCELMVDFYRRLRAGTTRVEALRQAQLTIKSRFSNPRFWGAFICQGDPGPISISTT